MNSDLNSTAQGFSLGKALVALQEDEQPDKGALLRQGILVEGELEALELPSVKKYLGPINDGGLGEIYGPRGLGKTWFRDALSLCLTRGQDFGPLKCEEPAGVLILDGEMPLHLLKERFTLAKHLGKPQRALDIISNEYLYRLGGPVINLSNVEWRQAILDTVKRGGDRWDVIFIDNLSSFLPGIRENDSEAWGPINAFLLELRWMGKAVIFIHHAGKSGDQRGTSGREDQLDFVWKLTPAPGHNPEDGCNLEATLTKSRSLTGAEAAPFTFAIVPHTEGGLTWVTSGAKESRREMIIALLGNGEKQNETAEAVGVSKGYVSRIKAAAIRDGILEKNGTTFTPTGRLQYGGVDIDASLL
ncbi:MAG: AAA family ATPase [Deltaproteobacteria bacterium]|nr:AAA family ATPase [Deltaproteobacteria bacterium]